MGNGDIKTNKNDFLLKWFYLLVFMYGIMN